jgi:DNA polymerase-3 subunit beta
MQFLIHRDELVRALGRAQGIVDKRPASPVLAAVLLQAEGDKLRCTATDKAITVITEYSANVQAAGEVAVDAANLFNVAKVLAGDIVTVALVDNGRLEIRSANSVFKLTTWPASDFPVSPGLDSARTLTIDAASLRQVIDRVHFAIAPDDNRYGLNGAHIEDTSAASGAVVRFVGTDGNRLCWAQAPYGGELGIGRKMLLPRKGLGEVRKLLDGYEGQVSISFGDRAALIQYPGVVMHVRLLEAEFPDYRQVLPSSFKRKALLERDAFREALKRVSILTSDASHSVRFQFSSEGLVLSARKLDAGESRDDVPCDFTGEPISMGFNARFVLDVLQTFEGPRVSVELGDALSPCILRDPDDDNALFVVMPVRLD